MTKFEVEQIANIRTAEVFVKLYFPEKAADGIPDFWGSDLFAQVQVAISRIFGRNKRLRSKDALMAVLQTCELVEARYLCSHQTLPAANETAGEILSELDRRMSALSADIRDAAKGTALKKLLGSLFPNM